MNNKGFTLIELLATIALLAAMSVVVGLSITNMLNNEKQKQIDEYAEKLEKAACLYVEHAGIDNSTCATNSSMCKIKFTTLIKNSLISRDLVNPVNNKTVSEDTNSYVQITWENYEKKCTYMEVG